MISNVIDNTSDIITENANEGTDSVNSELSHTLGVNFENLTLLGNSAVNGTANAVSNLLTATVPTMARAWW